MWILIGVVIRTYFEFMLLNEMQCVSGLFLVEIMNVDALNLRMIENYVLVMFSMVIKCF